LGTGNPPEEDEPEVYDTVNGSSRLKTRIAKAPSPMNLLHTYRADGGRKDRIEVGRLEVITGPMFSGKSEELIRRLKRARIARQRVACYKPDIDLRYHRTAIASHGAQTHDAETVANVERLREALAGQLDAIEVVGIDEGQFFDEGIIALAVELVHLGKRVILAGLDTTFNAEPFGPIPALMALADEVTKLSAVCMVCGAPAIHTQRLGASQELVVVGAAGVYEARCRSCFKPYLDENESEQMELPAVSEV
jgi:thymidine kinase